MDDIFERKSRCDDPFTSVFFFFFFHELEIADWVGEMPSKWWKPERASCMHPFVFIPHHKIYVNINCLSCNWIILTLIFQEIKWWNGARFLKGFYWLDGPSWYRTNKDAQNRDECWSTFHSLFWHRSQKSCSGWAWKSRQRNQHLVGIFLSPFSFCFLHLHLPPHFSFTDPHPPVEGLVVGVSSGVLLHKSRECKWNSWKNINLSLPTCG